ncbi:hypothetical protein ACVI3U_001706 [Sinorhizobium medicae]
MGEDIKGVPALHDFTLVDHRHVGSNRFHDFHLMGDEQHGKAQLRIDPPQKLQDRLRGFRVQRRGRLVREQQLGFGRKRPGDADALFLAAGKLRRIAPVLVGKTDEVEKRPHAPLDRTPIHAGDLERQRDIAEDGTRGKQVEMLEYHAHGAAEIAQARFVQLAHIDAVNEHLAARRLFEAVDEPDQGRFAGAGTTYDACDRTTSHRQADIVERSEGRVSAGGGKTLGYSIEDDRGIACRYLGARKGHCPVVPAGGIKTIGGYMMLSDIRNSGP